MAITTKTPVRTVFDASNAAVGLAEFQTDEVVSITHGGTSGNSISTAKLALSLTDSNIRALLSVSGSGSYDNSTGIITVTGGVTSVGGATSAVSNAQVASSITTSGLLTTANVAELTNLYFTNARVYSNVISIGYATNANVSLKANVVDLTTANVTELNNLYFTNARARLAITASGSINYNNATGVFSFTQGNTDTIVEGVTNLFFSNARSQNALTAGTGITISGGTISVASALDYGLIDGIVTSSNDYGSI